MSLTFFVFMRIFEEYLQLSCPKVSWAQIDHRHHSHQFSIWSA